MGTPKAKPTAKHEGARRSVSFPLDVEDGWPPVGIESLPFEVVPRGLKLLVPPLFVKKLSVGDVIAVRERLGRVSSWKRTQRSAHSTIWLLRLKHGGTRDINRVLKRLRELGCNSSNAPQFGSYAIDVPSETPMRDVDAVLARLELERVAVAYPSFRHSES
jgi:hypothetical protein